MGGYESGASPSPRWQRAALSRRSKGRRKDGESESHSQGKESEQGDASGPRRVVDRRIGGRREGGEPRHDDILIGVTRNDGGATLPTDAASAGGTSRALGRRGVHKHDEARRLRRRSEAAWRADFVFRRSSKGTARYVFRVVMGATCHTRARCVVDALPRCDAAKPLRCLCRRLGCREPGTRIGVHWSR